MYRAGVLILGVCNLAAASDASAQSSEPSFAIENVRVFDGVDVTTAATVVVQGDHVAFGTNVEVPQAAIRIDGAGRTLLPGLKIDRSVDSR